MATAELNITTVNAGTYTIAQLDGIQFVHPAGPANLMGAGYEYTLAEIARATDLQTHLSAGDITATDEDGNAISDITTIARCATSAPAAHATSHTDGTDDIQDATASVKGLATAAQVTKLDAIEAAADVTDAANVDAAGAVMESDYDAQTVLAAVADNTPLPITLAVQTVLGRVTAGNVKALTAAELTTIVDAFTSGLKGLAPASGGGTTNFLRADGSWAAPPGGAGGTPWHTWGPENALFLGSGFAQLSTYANHRTIAFDDATTEECLVEDQLSVDYAGGDLVVKVYFVAAATSGNVRWGASLERMDSGGQDLDSDSFGTEVFATVATSGTAGVQAVATLTLSSAAEKDSAAAGDPMRVRIRRIGGDAADTMSGDAHMTRWTLEE